MVHAALSLDYPAAVPGSLWSMTCGVNLEHEGFESFWNTKMIFAWLRMESQRVTLEH